MQNLLDIDVSGGKVSYVHLGPSLARRLTFFCFPTESYYLTFEVIRLVQAFGWHLVERRFAPI